ncbi:MAG: helix-turn-helix domain-containing protein [Thermoplasmatota archaeon]
MGHFTEVVYRLRNPAFPLCGFTTDNLDVKVVVNQTSFDSQAGVCRSVLSFIGPEDKLEAFAHEAASVCESTEISRASNNALTMTATTSLATLVKTGNPVMFGFELFGDRAVHTPAVVERGFFHERLLVLGGVNLPAVLAAYETGRKAGRWDDFKLMRFDEFDAGRQVHATFAEEITPKQLEVIKMALQLGFYNSPRGATLDDLSNIFGISKAAVHNRLKAAERKVISQFFS